MKLEDIKREMDIDSVIDPIKLSEESIRIPIVHNKWIQINCDEKRILKALNAEFEKLYLIKIEYYSGKAPDQEYIDNPYYVQKIKNLKVLNKDIASYVERDDEIMSIKSKKDLQEIKVEMVTEFIKGINQRSFNIKNFIEFNKFKNGMN